MRRKLIILASFLVLLLYFMRLNLFSPRDLVVYLSLNRLNKDNHCINDARTWIVLDSTLLAEFNASSVKFEDLSADIDSDPDFKYQRFGYYKESFSCIRQKFRKIDKLTIRVIGRNLIVNTTQSRLLISPIEIRKDYWYIEGVDELHVPTIAIFSPKTFSRKTIDFLNESLVLLIPEPSYQIIKDLETSRFVECRRDLAEKMAGLYKNELKINTSVINASIVDDMAYLRDQLRAINMTILLHSGSLLGWYRECGIIPHTTDIDLSFLHAEYNPKVDDVIRKDKRLKAYWRLGSRDDGLEYSTYAGSAKIDIFGLYYDVKANESWIGGMIVQEKEKIRFVYPGTVVLCSADLLGRLFHVPCDVERFLVADYGESWSYPHLTSNYVWDKSPKNLRRMGKFTDEEWTKVHKVFKSD